MNKFIAIISGYIFALGLGLSGMTEPHIVRGFLDIFGAWDWRLIGVMIGAIAVHSIAYRLILRRSSPVFALRFHLPTKKEIDGKLILGAVLFGLGWGWVGICPGPGIVALVSGKMDFLYFIIAMLVGMKSYQIFEQKVRV